MQERERIIQKLKFILILFIILFSSYCDESVNTNLSVIDCENLKEGIINLNSDIVKSEIDKIAMDLKPNKSNVDSAQIDNINILINRLNAQCKNINAELLCYSCIKTLPPQSEILVTTDSLGAEIKRVIDILTPSDSNLSCVSVHN